MIGNFSFPVSSHRLAQPEPPHGYNFATEGITAAQSAFCQDAFIAAVFFETKVRVVTNLRSKVPSLSENFAFFVWR
jgi:hypothetical protein